MKLRLRPCDVAQCLMDTRFCRKRCRYNGGDSIPRTRTGYPTAMYREMIAELRGDFRPGVVRATN
jgi:hypothetical protein